MNPDTDAPEGIEPDTLDGGVEPDTLDGGVEPDTVEVPKP